MIFLERLRALQAKAGLKGDAAATPQRQTGDNRPLAESGTDNAVRTRSIDPQFDVSLPTKAGLCIYYVTLYFGGQVYLNLWNFYVFML